MGEGVVVADREARLLVFNPAAERILGRGRADARRALESARTASTCPTASTPYAAEDLPLCRAIRGESVDQVELYHRPSQPPATDAGCSSTAGRLRDDQGAIQGGLVVFHDITRRKKFERRLAVAVRRRPASWPRPTRWSRPRPRSSRSSASGSTGTSASFWRVDSRHPASSVRDALAAGRRAAAALSSRSRPASATFAAGDGPARAASGRRREAGLDPRHLARDPNFPRPAAAAEEACTPRFARPDPGPRRMPGRARVLQPRGPARGRATCSR